MAPNNISSPVATTTSALSLVPSKRDRGEKIACIVEIMVSEEGMLSTPNERDEVRDNLLDAKLKQVLGWFTYEEFQLDFQDQLVVTCEFNSMSQDGGNDVEQALKDKFDNTLFLKNGREFQFVIVGSTYEPLVDVSCRRRLTDLF